jgi:hypothetical protein
MEPCEENPDDRQSAENGVAYGVFIPSSLAIHAVIPVNKPDDGSDHYNIQHNYDTTEAGRNPSQDANAQKGSDCWQHNKPKARHEALILAALSSRSR